MIPDVNSVYVCVCVCVVCVCVCVLCVCVCVCVLRCVVPEVGIKLVDFGLVSSLTFAIFVLVCTIFFSVSSFFYSFPKFFALVFFLFYFSPNLSSFF